MKKFDWPVVWWFALMLLLTDLRAADPPNLVLLTNASAIHQLSPAESALGHPVRLEGVVTTSDPEWGVLFIHDGTGGMFVGLASGAYPTNQEWVEVTGRTGEGGFQPVVTAATWRPLGTAPMPEPRRIDHPELFASHIDCEWSELVGVVRRVAFVQGTNHLQLDVMDEGWRVRAFLRVPRGTTLEGWEKLVDARVAVLGVAGVDRDEARGVIGLKLFVPNPDSIRVLEAAPPNPFLLPETPLANLRGIAPTNASPHRVHVQGAVTDLVSPGRFILQEGNGAVQVRLSPPGEVRLGDSLEVAGFSDRGLFSPVLDDALIRPAPRKLNIGPVSVPAARIMWGGYDSRLVRMTGTLQAQTHSLTDHSLTLLDDGILFRASFTTTNTPRAWSGFEEGDHVAVTGVCLLQGDPPGAPQGFQVLLRSEADAVCLSHVRFFSTTQVLWIVGLVAAAGGTILLWGMTLRRQVSAQTEIIRARLEQEAALEKRYHQLEAQFLRAQRQESIGALAGGIAHDLNNILAPILMAVPLLRMTTADPEGRRMLDTMEQCAERAADIIRQLLTFARGKPGARVPVPASQLLREMEKLIRETFPRNIQASLRVAPDLWPVLGDPTQIHQALMNLCVNGRDAMPDGGVLTLAAENRTLDAAATASHAKVQPGPFVCLSVTDSGTGIAPEHLERIFDPFFTTKEIGKGTGLGLPTVQGIVRGHGGVVRVQSTPGLGTTFELYLPASLGETASPPVSRPPPPARGAGQLVLVVDDEAAVRSVVERTLQQHGYRVLTAEEGAEALGLFVERRAEIKGVITDMMMPGMDGPALVQSLRLLEPRLPVLGMTGLAERASVKDLDQLELSALLTKPFAAVELLATLHGLLSGADLREPLAAGLSDEHYSGSE